MTRIVVICIGVTIRTLYKGALGFRTYNTASETENNMPKIIATFVEPDFLAKKNLNNSSTT